MWKEFWSKLPQEQKMVFWGLCFTITVPLLQGDWRKSLGFTLFFAAFLLVVLTIGWIGLRLQKFLGPAAATTIAAIIFLGIILGAFIWFLGAWGK